MRVIVLAAGKGERLRPLTEHIPKCLIELRPGLKLIDLQLRAMSSVGAVDNAVFIVGYRGDQVEEYLKGWTKFPVTTFYNPFFDMSNDLVSLWCATRFMEDGPFIVLNGDDVFSASVMENLSTAEGDICTVIDRKPAYDADDMKILVEGGLLRRLSKEIPVEEATGENIGMIRFQGEGPALLVEALNAIVMTPEHRPLHWLSAVQWIIDRDTPVTLSECKPEDWAEIDFHVDLHQVQNRLDAARELVRLIDMPPSRGDETA